LPGASNSQIADSQNRLNVNLQSQRRMLECQAGTPFMVSALFRESRDSSQRPQRKSL